MNSALLAAALSASAFSIMPAAIHWWGWLIIVLLIIVAILAVLYVVGSKLQKKQEAQKAQMEAMAQTMSMIIIDKKRMRMCDANLPKTIMEQTPKRLRKVKLPFVKAKIGPKIMTLIADQSVYDLIPVKKEIRAVVSGIYITEIKSVRGGSIQPPEPKKKKGLFRKKD